MRRVVLTLALLSLAACERPTPSPSPAPAADAPAPPAATPRAGALAPEALFFVGRWAAEAKMCDDPWVITAQELTTPGHVVCRFEQVSRTDQGLEAQAACTAEGPPEPRRLRFAYAQSARALMIAGGPFNDIGLVRCPGSAYPPADPPDPGEPGGLADDRTPIPEAPFLPTSPQGAASIVERYFAEVGAQDYASAWRLWADTPGRPPDAEALARSLAAYDSYNALIGAPGAAEGAAGSLYVRVPVQVYARLKDGREVHRLGTATLRRANEAPGSTAEQRSWRIYAMELQPQLASEGRPMNDG